MASPKPKPDESAPDTAADTGLQRAYRARLEPVGSQRRDLFGFADARRWVWNECVAWMEDANMAAKSAGATWPPGVMFSLTHLCRMLDDWCLEQPWLALVPKQALQQAVIDFIRARKAFLTGAVEAPPKFKRVRDAMPTVRFPQSARLNQNAVLLPKLGWVKYRNSFNRGRGIPPGELRSATVSFQNGHWWVSLLMKQERIDPTHTPSRAVGIDSGVTNTLALSSRINLHAPVATEDEADRIRFLERRVARCELGSARRARAKARLDRFRSRITRRLHDWRHKTTTKLTKNHGLIAVEELALKNMTASAKGTVEAPGTRVRQKAGLNRALLEPGFGIIHQQLAYKQAWRGHAFVRVPPAYTSQRCPVCEHVAAENRVTRDHFRCVRCGAAGPADFVAATNILVAGKQILAAGQACHCAPGWLADPETTGPRTREPNLPSVKRAA